MNELRNLLRHIIPGVVFTIELIILILFTLDKSQLTDFLKVLNNITIGSAIGLLLAFTGLGFLFSIIHHTLYHEVYRRILRCYHLDYGSYINRIRKNGILSLKYVTGEIVSCDENFNSCGEWRIINSIWYSRIKESSIISGVQETRNVISWDIAHSNGAAFVGSIFAILLWFILFHFFDIFDEPVKINFYPYIVVFIFIIVHLLSLWRTIKIAVGFPQNIISKDLYEYKKKSIFNKAYAIIISKNDLNEPFLIKIYEPLKRFFNLNFVIGFFSGCLATVILVIWRLGFAPLSPF